MANVNGEWLDREARQKRIELLEATDAKLERLRQAGELRPSQLNTLVSNKKELIRLKRIHRAEYDVLYFTYEYFSEEGNPGNPSNLIPQGQTFAGAAKFHKELCGLLDDVSKGETESHIGWSVGRRHAKTAYLSNAYVCHQVVFRLKKYIAIISQTTDMAGDFASWTRFQLKHNIKLREDFGELLSVRASQNELDNKTEFITSGGTKVEAKGVGTQVRGMRYLNHRPDLFILDDLESNENTNTAELRAKNLRWFRSEMLEALGFGGMAIYMGTIVHYDSLLNHVLTKRRDFTSRKFPAILSWSEREDLWQEWREIYNEDNEDAKKNADEFYESNKDEMLRGTEVLWPQMYSYKYFMEKREEMGAREFNQEYLGNPTDESSQIFHISDEHGYFYPDEVKHIDFDFYCGIDFAMGKERGDYSAIITVARNKATGVNYVWDTFIERVHPDKLLEKAAELAMKYQYEGMAVEAQMAQEWWADQLSKELKRRGYPADTRVRYDKQKLNKQLRIETMVGDINRGHVKFQRHQRLLIDMLEMYPNHNHDDGPDALQMALNISGEIGNQVRTVKRMNRW